MPADDVWSLGGVLYEMVDRIRRQRLVSAAGSAARSDTGSAVIEFVASMLTAPRSARPANARAFAEARPKVPRDE